MKILISAYACDPYRGSEPGVGWAAMIAISKHHDVYVLTDVHNKQGWEKAKVEGLVPANVQVRFLRDRSACSANRFIAHVQSWMNYRDFNRKVLKAAREWHESVSFDLCHHLTVAAWRLPSSLWQMPIPFIWGPIGGAGVVAPGFRPILSPSARLFEKLRDLSTWMTLRSKAFQECVEKSAVIFPANQETLDLLAPYRKADDMVKLPIASLSEEKVAKFMRAKPVEPHQQDLRLFAGGNMIGSKGLAMALKALVIVREAGVGFHYTIAGGGPEIPKIVKLIQELDLGDRVTLHPGFRGDEYIAALQSHDIYFLPSLREGTPVTMLEALLAGCYPVVADASTQGEIAKMVGGIAAHACDPIAMSAALAEGIIWCDSNRTKTAELASKGASIIARNFSSNHYIDGLCEAYRTSTNRLSRA